MNAPLVGALGLAAAILALALAALGARPVGRVHRHPDRAALADAGWRFGLAWWEAGRVATVALGAGLASLVGLPTGLGIIVGLGPSVAVRIRAQGARDRARAAVTQLLLAAHGMLRSGVALPEALRRASVGCDDVVARRPFALALRRFDLGEPLDAAIRDAAAATPDRRTALLLHTLALGVTERLPIERAAALLEALAERALFEERLSAEVRARAAGVRTQSYALAAVVPCLAVYLVATMPGLGATLAAPIGRAVLIPLAIVLEVAGVVIGRRVVRGVSQ